MRYKSRYTDKYVQPSQYLSELICEKAAHLKGDDLPMKFWNHPKYKREFILQTYHAAALLKVFPIEPIISALKNPKASKIYSLGAPHLVPIIEEEQAKLKNPSDKVPLLITDATLHPIPPQLQKKSLFNKLNEINNG